MYIKRIEINNFRIYKGKNILNFDQKDSKNVFVISGYNGFGKTTLLTGLVWCLYGKNMQEVDKIYKEKILEKGGYKNYLKSSINFDAEKENDRIFSIKLELSDLNIPGMAFHNIEIERVCDSDKCVDKLFIKIDGETNELVEEVNEDIFINDYILPKEIAKFFFFDAEKISSIAEIKSLEDKRSLSSAYSEVLGIKKYEDLKLNLNDLRLKFRSESVKDSFFDEFELLKKKKESLENNKNELLDELKNNEDLLIGLVDKSSSLQEKLIRKGSDISISEINSLKERKVKIQSKIQEINKSFKEMIVYAPFAISFNLIKKVQETAKIERKNQKKDDDRNFMESKLTSIKNDLKSKKIKDFNEVENILNKHLLEEVNENLESIHNLSSTEIELLDELVIFINSSYKSNLKSLSRSLSICNSEMSSINGKLSNAELKESDPSVKLIRDEKNDVDAKIKIQNERIQTINRKIGENQGELLSTSKKFEVISKKVKVLRKYNKKDKLSKKMIVKLDKFLMKIKNKKKVSLQNEILSSLNTLMHKNNFVKRVEVIIEVDFIDIKLYDKNKKELNTSDFSKGEQQLYATSILNALVKESNIQFPVFVDSPLQKFDDKHAKSIVSEFYPSVSKQVVIFPLLNKEINSNEYDVLKPKVSSSFVIQSESNKSKFVEVNPNDLFVEYEKILN